ncbi:PQQ-dependent sugar dehydrogenase [Rhodoblastus acidophilus]|uniref:PQQ-dependent sugar dehydrogenase n=1 Tax=Candidatus Rhodoblastus alkanivorans TaxID=2954117 RepID=A0ABS9Z109_9HYPH|nr:PQQ-dependent sugar dehydrogenase [Candidatus Rhodoblastus alkanivorans]MCI4678563.1 PQQ-dependent sugar dehydrogenase [Candidatus Rhodoblastus alkanivorans]MCI4681349.1 PQQ-dependent sugar dehydrogenase [Candidatus Rhodoblastus alkanivorans]
MRRAALLLLALAAAVAVLAFSRARPDHAAELRAVLAKIRLPQGFHIALYGLVPDARGLAVSPDGRTLIVGSSSQNVYRVALGPKEAQAASRFSPNHQFVMPSSPCFAPDGTLFLAAFDRVVKFAPRPGGWDEDHPQVIVPPGKLIPADEKSHGHGLRVCQVGPDGRLYVAVGQPTNVPTPTEQKIFAKWGLGGILRFDRNGENREIFASGIRNSVGMDFQPGSDVLWFTDNQVDGMGDDIPPEELNKAPRAGLNFGFPWYGGGHVRTRQWAGDTPPAGVAFPELELDAHAADLGVIFYRGKIFPENWRGIFIAQHGSWNRSVPIGARVIFVPFHDGKPGAEIPFAEGWNPGATPFLGRPVALAELPDGSLIVSDDQEGALYRIYYDGK